MLGIDDNEPSTPAPQVAPDVWQIAPGYVPGMHVPVRLYASPQLLRLLLEEVEKASATMLWQA